MTRPTHTRQEYCIGEGQCTSRGGCRLTLRDLCVIVGLGVIVKLGRPGRHAMLGR
jgi:hypothetical protein